MRMAAVATAAGVAYALGWLSRQPQVAAARREANTDRLTGLPNRAGLQRQLRMRTKARKPYTVCMLDLNGFKPVNDTFGHRAGDVLLQGIARHLQVQLGGHLVARLGGDEFVVLIDGPVSPMQAGLIAYRIGRAVAQPIIVPGSSESVVLTAAMGIASTRGGDDDRLVIHAADLAMYRSKTTGRPVQITTALPHTVDESPSSRIRDRRAVRVA